jgi:hypothetical protein
MKVKYTNDNKKVAIVGKLNNKESIVQEIFIKEDGSEIPSGENFVVKSLHDAPVKSWKEEKAEEIEKRYNEVKEKYDSDIKIYRKNFENEKLKLTAKTEYLKKFISKAAVEHFEILEKFLKGEIKFLVQGSYSPKIIKYKDFISEYDGRNLRLLCMYGKDDGTIGYGINRYPDGSGSWDNYFPFSTHQEAVKKLSEIVKSKTCISEYTIKLSQEYGFELNQDALAKYRKEKIEDLEERIKKNKSSIKECKDRLKEIKNL